MNNVLLTLTASEPCVWLRLPVLVKKAVNDTTAFWFNAVFRWHDLFNWFVLKMFQLESYLEDNIQANLL